MDSPLFDISRHSNDAASCNGLMADKARIPQQTIISTTKEKRKERRLHTYIYMIFTGIARKNDEDNRKMQERI